MLAPISPFSLCFRVYATDSHYESLAKNWIGSITKQPVNDFEADLKSGVVLCKYVPPAHFSSIRSFYTFPPLPLGF